MVPQRGNGGVGAVNGFGCHTDMETHGFVAALSFELEEAHVSGSEDPLVLNNLVIIRGKKKGENCIINCSTQRNSTARGLAQPF